jgi:hypothetical protein
LAKVDRRRLRIEKEIVWGRPVFRPPELVHPQVALDPLPFRTQSYTFHRASVGR